MSVDVLQEKIRKLKNPSVVLFEALPDLIPDVFVSQDVSVTESMDAYFTKLLTALRGSVPAVRFGFGSFALLGNAGTDLLQKLLSFAKKQGFYVLLDAPEMLTPAAATNAAKLLGADSPFVCDGIVVGAYLGSDVLLPFRDLCKAGKSVFAVARTSNKSAVELQDLLTGGRLVHIAAVDVIARHGETVVGKCGYSNLGAVAAAGSAGSLRTLRSKYNRVFLLLDGYDYPNANAKNCSFAFDRLGHGGAACACAGILGAWKDGEGDPVELAVQAAERMKKNLTRYVNIL